MGFTRYDLVSYQRVVTRYCRGVRGMGVKITVRTYVRLVPGRTPYLPPNKHLTPFVIFSYSY
nr:MAG TPA: hypothetical protein [Caudoviricetes sp.]